MPPPKKIKLSPGQPNIFQALKITAKQNSKGTSEEVPVRLVDNINTAEVITQKQCSHAADSVSRPENIQTNKSASKPSNTQTSCDQASAAHIRDRTAHTHGLSAVDANAILNEYFPEAMQKKTLHCYYTCCGLCNDISTLDKTAQSSKADKFKHTWLLNEEMAYSTKTGMWWLIYIEGQGMYCLLCRVHNKKNKYNKECKFNTEPAVRYNKSAIFNANVKEGVKKDLGHAQTSGHIGTFLLELERRKSPLAHDYKEFVESKDKVTYNAMMSAYWLNREEVATRKLKSLLQLQQQAGLSEMRHWQNTSQRSQREQHLLLGQLIKQKVIERVKESTVFSVLVDEVTDLGVIEQLLIFVGSIDDSGETHFDFLEIVDCFEKSDSANSETIANIILNELQASGLCTKDVCGFGSDGANVMVGVKNGVGVRLGKVCPIMLRTHCTNHRLALACGDSNDEVKYITTLETILQQLWYWLEYPKRTAAYIKVCNALHIINVPESKKKVLSVKIQKACRTRWLSTGQSVASVARNLVPLLSTLRNFKETDATAHGLLLRMNNAKFVGVLMLLNEVLPHLNVLCKVLQSSKIHYSAVQSSLTSTLDRIAEVRDSNEYIEKVVKSLSVDGQYSQLELTLTDHDRILLINLCDKYTKALEHNLNRRLQAAAPVLQSFGIFDPCALPNSDDDAFQMYGVESIEVLANQFQISGKHVNAEWQNFKYLMSTWQVPKQVKTGKDEMTSTVWLQTKMVKEQAALNLSFPNMVKLAKICLVQPISNAVVERGASAVKRVKTRLRNRMKNDMFSALLHCTINGPAVSSPECGMLIDRATTIWRSTHKRNLPPVRDVGSSKVPISVPVADMGIQTENTESQEELKEPEREMGARNEIHAALECLDMMQDTGSDSDPDSDFECD